MVKEFHARAFQAHTLTKLRLYKAYIKAWLPVFMTKSRYVSEIWLFDLFCGPGCDRNEIKGSPLILLDELVKYLHCPSTNNPPKINIVFNDRIKWKISHLEKLIQERPSLPNIVSIHLTSHPYADIFPNVAQIANRKDTACFIFIDQCGINAISDFYIKQLASFPVTDWLAFVASSAARRFNRHKNITLRIDKTCGWKDAHRSVADTCRDIVNNDNYYIVPFSIKNGNNIHGLLFGTSHPSGAEKFINACWKEDKNAGEANFDIDGIIQNSSQMLKLFSTKLEAFEDEFQNKIILGEISDTKAAYHFALQNGVKAKHAKDALRKMKKAGIITATPPLSYKSTILQKNIRKITIKR